MSFKYSEWWLWGPQEEEPLADKEEYEDGEDAYFNYMEEQERKYHDACSQI